MAIEKRLGVFVKVPTPGMVKTRLTPPFTAEEACRVYEAFLTDLFQRLARLKKVRGTAFFWGDSPEKLKHFIPNSYDVTPQQGASLGERLQSAFQTLLVGGNRLALIIGSDSPDLPIQYVKRAFLKLKHKDVVLGPACDGGYYMIGVKSSVPELFDGIDWGEHTVFEQTLERVHRLKLTLSLMPMWYDVDNPPSLSLLATMIRARRIERSGRLQATEAVLDDILNPGE